MRAVTLPFSLFPIIVSFPTSSLPKHSVSRMHPSSLENMRKCYERYVLQVALAAEQPLTVLDIGGADVNGSYRQIFTGSQFRYLTADISAAAGVDIVLEDPYHVPLPDACVDIVLSGQMLEHCELFWLSFQEMVRLMSKEGYLFLIAPSAGPIHRYPVDCYRFFPDAFAALAKYSGCHLQDVWRDERGPWQDLVGVFRHAPLPPVAAKSPPALVRARPAAPQRWDARPEEEIVAGAVDYSAVLAQAHALVQPDRYLEIGVRHGRSLALARCPAIGVDPEPDVSVALGARTQIVATTSDRFFEEQAAALLPEPPDLVFIDGMHHFECALRDFMNVERLAAPTTLVVIDDIFPNHPRQAARDRATRVWSGDIWKLHLCLREVRPDLFLLPLDTTPTGLLLVAGLDPQNRTLWEAYNPTVKRYRDQTPEAPPEPVIRRVGAVAPSSALVAELLRLIGELRCRKSSVGELSRALAAWHGRFTE